MEGRILLGPATLRADRPSTFSLLSVSDLPTPTTKQPHLTTVREGHLLDYVSQTEKKDTPKEAVRQHVARAIVHELHINPDDMETDVSVSYSDPEGNSRRKKVDLVIYNPGSDPEERGLDDIVRAVVIKGPPNVGKRSVAKLRDHQQAAKDLDELKDIMTALSGCTYGMWTNGLDFFHLKKEDGLFEDTFKPLAFWPQVDETFSVQDHASTVRLRSGDAESLKTAFRRCHNFIHGNEGMPKDAAFWQFLYLIFSKIHDERRDSEDRRFLAGPDEQYSDEGRKAIRARVEPIFEAVKKAYPSVFAGNEQISISDRALAFLVSELAKYDFSRSAVDVKGAAYQELVGNNLRGDRGQYFTPKSVVNLAVEILDPKPHERVLDPACGTGGFLVSTLAHQLERFRRQRDQSAEEENTSEFIEVVDQLQDYANRFVFGTDFDPFLVRAAKMNIVLASGADGNIYHLDSLAFPAGHLSGVEQARERIPLGSVDVLLTNPPFGADIPITDPALLSGYEFARAVERNGDRVALSGKYVPSVAPETLFVEKCVKWLKPGGRAALVLPNGLLSNPGDGATASGSGYSSTAGCSRASRSPSRHSSSRPTLTSIRLSSSLRRRPRPRSRRSAWRGRPTTPCSWPSQRRRGSTAAATRSTSGPPTERRSSSSRRSPRRSASRAASWSAR